VVVETEHVQQILNGLIFDGLVEEVKISNAEIVYKLTFPYRTESPTDGLTLTPCGICPVFHLCGKSDAITPIKCVYLTKWSDIEF